MRDASRDVGSIFRGARRIEVALRGGNGKPCSGGRFPRGGHGIPRRGDAVGLIG